MRTTTAALWKRMALILVLLGFASSASYACNLASLTVNTVTDNGDGTFTITVEVCLGVDVNWGAVTDFSITPSGGTYTGIQSLQTSNWTSTYQYCAAGCGFMGCADGNPPVTGNGNGTGSVMGGSIDFSGGNGAGAWLAPDDLDATCINGQNQVCDFVTFTTNGQPTNINLNFSEGNDNCDLNATLPPPTTCSAPLASITMPPLGCAGGSFDFQNNGSTGSSMGSALYTYDWTFQGGTPGTSTDEDPSGVTWGSGGSYDVTLTVCDASDPTCCATVTQTFVVGDPPTLAIVGTDETCDGFADGSADLTVSGGTAPYSYSWDNGAGTGEDPSGLDDGTYTVTVTDAVGCVVTASVTIAPGGAPTPGFTTAGAACFTGNSFDFTNTGSTGTSMGSPLYNYDWDFGGGGAGTSTDENPSGVSYNAPGSYTVTQTVTDGNGCIAVTTLVIDVHPEPVLVLTPTDESCAGANDGAVDLAVSGGTAAYTYSWDNGASSEDLSGLAPGTYTVTVTDANNCTATASVSINPGITLNGGFTYNGNQCLAGNSYVFTNTGTTGATYSWDFGDGGTSTAENPSYTYTAAGTYNVTQTITSGLCTEVTVIQIEVYPMPTVVLAGTDLSCFGVCDGTVTATGGGGGGGYTYDWGAAGSGATLTGLCAGTYTVTVTDINNCSVTDNITIVEPPVLAVTAAATDASCNGVCDGTVTAGNATGGTAPYTYAWDGGLGAGQAQTGVCAGTYTVTVTDANGCTATATVTVNEPPVLAVTATATDETCGGLCDGTVSANNATGGTGPYSYAWDGGLGAGQNQTGVCAGTYTVTVTDANGCTATATVTVNAPPVLAVTAAATDASCNGVCDGTVTANNATGGTAPYTYAWDGGLGAGQAQTGVCAGTYTVTVTDANGCTATATVTVNEPAVLAVTTAATDASCNAICDGTVTANNATGGTGPYSYAWDGGLGSGQNHTGVCAGTYTVTVTDANGCTATATATVNEPPVLAVTATATDASCNGVCDGTVTAGNATGGTAPYTYAWDGGLGAVQAQTGVCAGTYTVTVTDANGCTATATVTVNQPPVLVITASATDELCAGACDGTVTADNATGGTAPYSYTWDGGLGAGQAQTGVCAGTYTVTVTDANGCTATATVTVASPPALAVTASATDASCSGVCDGTATAANATGGTAPYTYAWDGGLGAGASQTGVCAGTYTVTVTDANGCTATATVTVNEPPLLTAAIAGTDASCNGVCDGAADLTVGGGTGPYTYAWDNATTTEDQTGLCVGTYNVTVTDANGCTATASVTINEPTAITLTTSTTDASCGVADGTATVTASGGAGGYTYSWSSGGNAATETGLAAGSYTVTVTDANLCTETATVTINDLGAPTATITASTDVSCNGGNNGSATVTAAGGSGTYSYSWSPTGGTGATASGLIAGTYTVTVTDDVLGCTATASIVINEPPVLVATISASTDPLCAGACDGTATVTVSGGTAPYNYLWSTGGGSDNETGMCAGAHTVTITDANGCAVLVNVTLTDPPALVLSVAGTDATCAGVCDGAADLTASGGTAPYSFSWDNGGTTEDLTGLCAGTFTATVTDANGCIETASVTINEPAPLILTTSGTDATCGNANGTATVAVTGGTGAYTYSWNSGGNTDTETGLAAGTYTVTVIDANNCVETATFTVNDIAAGTATATVDNHVTCFGVCDGQATVTIVGGTAPFSYLWSTGGTGATEGGLCAGVHTVDITDASGCVLSASVTITEPTVLDAVITFTADASCNGVCDGSATVTPSGGTSPYTYSWATGGTTDTETGLCAGTADVTVTDANGCTFVATATINEPPVLTASIVGTDASCNGVCDGAADLTVGGGTAPYTFAWDNSATSEDLTGLCIGTYSVTVTDANGCTETASVTINEPTPIVLTTSTTDANCGQADGSASVTATGGTGGYTYSWSSGGSADTETGLAAGSYTVTVTDANLCTETATVTINDIGGGTATATVDNHVSCFGVCDGQATITMAGGTAPYTYLWSTGGTGATEGGLCAGTHTVDVTDAVGCISSASVTITEPTAMMVTVAGTDVTCNSACDGSADVTVSGGTGPYTFAWAHGPTAEDLTGILCDGTYDVTVTDANGCTETGTVIITQPTPITINNTSVLQVSCFGLCNGQIGVNASGGTGTLIYDWVDDATGLSVGSTASVTNVCAGSYTVTITDDNLCTQTANVTVTEPPVLTLSLNITDANCGQADGAACVVAVGGVGPYTYQWDNGPTTDCNNGITAGSYTVTVTDANLCPQQITATVNDLGGGTPTVTVDSHVSCFGLCDGQATVTMSGGTAPYIYLWSTGGTGSTESGLCAGTHTVDITDAVGCISSTTVTITEPLALAATVTGNDASCNGVCDGDATVVATDGTAPYTYAWTSGGTNDTETGLCAGSYDVTVTDANGCTVTVSVTIAEPTAIVVTTAVTDATCGQSNGTLSATAVGGAGGYTFTWTQAGNPVADPNAVPAGTYDVLVTDADGCAITATVNVNDLTGPSLTFVSSTDPGCPGATNGDAVVSATGGTGPITIDWTTAGQTGPTANGLGAGSYPVTATDSTGCAASINVVLTDPPFVTATISASTDATVFGVCDGTADVTASGGTPGYTYQWYDSNTGSAIPGATNSSIANLCAQEYCVVVTDANGCTDSVCVVINEPNAILITLTGTDATCPGACDGSISATVTGGTTPYSYEWFDNVTGLTIGQTTATATGLCAGDYYLVVTDANGGSSTSSVYIVNEPAPITATTQVISDYNGQNISCAGACDGSAEVTPTGGTPPYTYEWFDNVTGLAIGQTTPIANNLCAGTYDVVVTDDNNCQATFTITLSEPLPLDNLMTVVDASCFGNCDGSITTNVTGGTPPYTYFWDIGLQTTPDINNQCANTYTLTVTDANGCVLTDQATITEPQEVIAQATSNGANCAQNDGDATVTITQGVGPFGIFWNAAAGNQVGATADSLFAGCYTAVVIDSSTMCTDTVDICVVDLGAPTVNILTVTDVSCFGACDGFIQLQVFGGTAPYNYQWCDNQNNPLGPPSTSPSFIGACAGTYIGKMTDANGCTAFITVTVNEPPLLSAVIQTSTDVTCFGDCDGTATVAESGGTAPYTYLWTPSGQTTATATALCPGVHSVTVTDANGCDTIVSVTINEPMDIFLSASSVDAFCNTASGTATVVVDSGGVGGITYQWDAAAGNQTNATALGLVPGNYCCSVTDANGCTQTICITVGNIPEGVATTTNVINVSCFGGNDGSVNVSMGGSGTPPYNYEWFNANGVSTAITGSGPPFNAATGLTAGDYYVVVTDANGCVSISDTTTITEPPLLVVSTTVVDVSCNGGADGEALAAVTGGSPGYSYLWTDNLNQTVNPAVGLEAGSYTVTVTDSLGCTAQDQAVVNEPPAIALDSTVTNANCGQSDGQACVITSGGVAPYTYLWPDGSTNSCVANIPAGTYCVTVTDFNGCSEIICVEVSDISGPSASIVNSQDVSCFGDCDGSAEVDMIGGTGSYSVVWDAQTGNQGTPAATNLCAGTYTVTITDSVGCTASTSVTINEPAPLATNPQFSDPTCFGDCDGAAWISVAGGTAPYSYQWLDGLSQPIGTNNDTILGLCSGTYQVVVTDANNCTEIINYTITDPLPVTGTSSGTDVSCFGGCDGTATATGTQGVAPFTYLWDAAAGSQTTQTANGLCAGTYSCTIYDADSCFTVVTVTINEPTELIAGIAASQDVSCNGLCDGFAQASVTGGTGPYTYSWSNGAGISQVASNICAGTYTVVITDFNGCVDSATVVINEPTAVAVSINTIDVSCAGVCDGQLSAVVTGGVGNYSYQWSDASGTPIIGATNAVYSNACAGSYSVRVTDANGCIVVENATILQPTSLGINVTATDANCGQSNGQICISIVGGVSPFVVQWNDPQTQTSLCAGSLAAACYTVLVTDANGCTLDSTICLNDIAGPTISFVGSTNVSCTGASDGTVSFNITAGAMPYQSITWTDGQGNPLPQFDGLMSANNLSGDCYNITVVDAASCTQSLSACISEPALMISGITDSVMVSCNGFCDGTATVTVNGGTAPLTYSWNGGNNPGDSYNTGLCAGTYTVNITDANGCTSTSSVVITEPAPIAITGVVTDVSCFGGNNGIVDGAVTGGTGPYLYSWTPGSGSGPTIAGLTAGSYSMQVTDANGCFASSTFIVNEPPVLLLSASAVPSTCSDANGTAVVTPTGGTAPYQWSWPNGDVTAIGDSLLAGTHTVTVTDAQGCVETIDVIITDMPGPVVDSISFISPQCNGLSNGSATVHHSGGTAGFTYLWDDQAQQVSQTAIALEDGLYCVVVTDNNGCTASQCVQINEPSPLTPIPLGGDTVCYGDSTQIWATGQGGTLSVGSNYIIHWDPGTGLAGTGPHNVSPTVTTDYCFSVEDEAGCLSPSACITVTVTPALDLDVTPNSSICEGESIQLVATGTGGNGNPYDYQWHEGAVNGPIVGNTSSITVSPITPTWYYVILSDGCSIDAIDSVQVSINANPIGFLNVIDSAGCAPFTAQFTANSDIGVTYEWDFDCDGVIDNTTTSTNVSWTYDTPGLYTVCLTITSADGCDTTIIAPDIVEVYPVPVAAFSLTPETTTSLNPTIYFSDLSAGAVWYDWNFGDPQGSTLSGPDTSVVPVGTNGGQTSGTYPDPIHTYADTGVFTVTLTVTNEYGCTDYAQHEVYIEGDYILFAPSAFTPNGDGINDFFFPVGIGISGDEFEFYVFDRWGELIWEGFSPDDQWDGTVKGTGVVGETEVYVWLIRTRDNKGQAHEYIGHVTLLK